jgi:hypothetical protein
VCSLHPAIPLVAIHIVGRCRAGGQQHDAKQNGASQDDEKSGSSKPKPPNPKHADHVEDAREEQESDEFRHARVQVLLPRDPPEDTSQPCRQGSEP